MNLRFLICLALLLFPFIQSIARPIYVSVNRGDDTQDGSSLSKPLKSIQAASDQTRPGDTVYIEGGIYESTKKEILKITRSGTEKKWIVYRNLNEDRPVLRIRSEAGIVLESVSYISIEGLEITRDVDFYERTYLGADPDFVTSSGNGIYIGKVTRKEAMCHHIRIQDNRIHGCPGSGILIHHTDYLTISFNKIHDNGELNLTNNSGIRLQQLVDLDQKEGYHIIINGNVIYNQRRLSRLEEEISFCEKTYSASGISLRDNRYGGSMGQNPGYSSQILVSNNLIYNNGGIGLDLLHTDQVKAIHNTFFRNNRNAKVQCGELYGNNISNCVIANNIFYANTGKPATRLQNYEQVEIGHNLYHNGVGYTPGPGDILADPLFVRANNNESIFDFSLKPKSPAIDAGDKKHTTAYDHAGALRLGGTEVDLGALEYYGSRPLAKNYAPAQIDERSIKLFWQASYVESTRQLLISNHRGRIFSARLYDSRGKLIKQYIQDESSYAGIEFDLSDYPEGIYFLVAFSDRERLINRYRVKR